MPIHEWHHVDFLISCRVLLSREADAAVVIMR